MYSPQKFCAKMYMYIVCEWKQGRYRYRYMYMYNDSYFINRSDSNRPGGHCMRFIATCLRLKNREYDY